MSSVRYRGEKNIVELAKNLDAFKIVREEYRQPTKIGGTVSLLSRLFIVFLIYIEISYFLQSSLIFSFKPDLDMDDKVRMHVDMTIAMPCVGLSGVDLTDDTQQDTFSYGALKRESTYWDLSSDDRLVFDQMQHINSFLREEFHSVADIVFKDILQRDTPRDRPKSSNVAAATDKPFDACRLHGTFTINKVAGVLHLVSGNAPIFGLQDIHWHINDFHRVPANFSHRINKLSFGDFSKKLIQPLEGDERYVKDDSTVVQYFIKIVPTEIHNIFSTINTYQYSVTENFRVKDSQKNSFGMPGIYFKYDWSALKVIVRSDRDNLVKFIIRLCSIISGIVVISGLLNSIIQLTYTSLLKCIAPTAFTKDEKTPIASSLSTTSVPPAKVFVSNNLISNANQMAPDNLLFTVPQ